MHEAVTPMGCDEVDLCGRGEDALEAVQEHEYDVVLLDLLLDDMDGLTVLQEIQRITPDTPVLMISIVSEWSRIQEAREAGAADFLTKPFEPEELRESIRAVLQERS